MKGLRSHAVLLGLLLAHVAISRGVTLEIHNATGAVHVTVSSEVRVEIEGKGLNRPATRDDVKITRHETRTIVRCDPADGERVDLAVQVPIGFLLDVTTEDGAIEVAGLVRLAHLETKTGDILLTAPWSATRLQLDAVTKPAKFSAPDGVRFSGRAIDVSETQTIWRLRDRLPERRTAYGQFQIEAEAPGEVRLTDMAVPEDSPVKMHWQAAPVLDSILRSPQKLPPPPPAEQADLPTSLDDAAGAVFRSDVRMVNLIAAVTNQGGAPATDLRPEDFIVIEDGVAQEVASAGSESMPFNLAILMDLSGSTRPDREAMGAAAERFVGLAGPEDRVAVYALAGDMFHVISRLTTDREGLIRTLERLPDVSGASPLYDCVVLGYAEELHQRPGERNALIVISDGIDNRLSNQETPSEVRFNRLRRMAEEMNALIYPVFLRSGERFGRNWSKKALKNMQDLADASGGRVFPAMSIQDLEPVFPLIEAELRSVYGVAYYPKEQTFDGGWRTVKVQVKRPGAKVRARAGYYAR